MNDVTRILSAIEQGDPSSAGELLPLVYDELRKLAAARLARESPDQTLSATALVHEVYLRLVGKGAEPHWNSRGHFFAAAAEAMRRILVDQARRKRGPKAGGHLQRVTLEHADPSVAGPNLGILALNEALQKLAAKDPRKAELVKLRFFAGLTSEQAAAVLGVASSTVDLDWAYAKSWLRAEMSGHAAPGPDFAEGGPRDQPRGTQLHPVPGLRGQWARLRDHQLGPAEWPCLRASLAGRR